jgi:hypothetical protein
MPASIIWQIWGPDGQQGSRLSSDHYAWTPSASAIAYPVVSFMAKLAANYCGIARDVANLIRWPSSSWLLQSAV